MDKLRFVGLDVHAESISIAVADEGSSAPEFLARIPHDLGKLKARLRELGKKGSVQCCFEAGPTGFGLARTLGEAGYECLVVAPSRVPDVRGNRIKTDGRDAIRLARFLRSGDLTPIHVPDGETEAMRDLARAREDACFAANGARQQLGHFLLRHGRRYGAGKQQGTKKHLLWVRSQKFEHEAQRRVLADYLAAYEVAKQREAKLMADLTELVESWSLAPLVRALMAMRGVDLLTAATVVAEIGNFARFATAPQFASFLGLTPSEHSSGEKQVRGRITRHGNEHVRRLLTEAAWHYRFPTLSQRAAERGRNTNGAARAIAQKAQDRLYRRFARLSARGKEKNKVAIAVARELACFMWAMANDPEVRAQISAA